MDTVGDPGKYQSKLQELFPQLTIEVTKKADSLFPIVSAASICAKVLKLVVKFINDYIVGFNNGWADVVSVLLLCGQYKFTL